MSYFLSAIIHHIYSRLDNPMHTPEPINFIDPIATLTDTYMDVLCMLDAIEEAASGANRADVIVSMARATKLLVKCTEQAVDDISQGCRQLASQIPPVEARVHVTRGASS
jgi:hypothetical protein